MPEIRPQSPQMAQSLRSLARVFCLQQLWMWPHRLVQASALTATELTNSPNQDFGVQKIFPVVKIRSPHSPTEQWEFCRSLTLTAMAASADACTWVSAEPPPPDNPRVRHEA
uniref:Uncharacterized protein n=1 Tax=Eutreptiella gymnastica TaxID=73025 RepID=A0A7S4G5V3_9EUGL